MAIAASTPTTSQAGAAGAGAKGRDDNGVQARQPRTQAAIPLVASSAAPSPARATPSVTATCRSAS